MGSELAFWVGQLLALMLALIRAGVPGAGSVSLSFSPLPLCLHPGLVLALVCECARSHGVLWKVCHSL